MTQRTILFWCDLETTGLDERFGVGEIMEYAVVLTDLELNEVDSTEGIIAHAAEWLRDCMDEYVTDMHTKNGLLDEIQAISNTDHGLFGHAAVVEAEKKLVSFLLHHQADDVIFVIAGSTVGFDRRWLKVHMPELEAILHCRQLDVSTYKVGFPKIFGTETSNAHRAMADIRASIEQHRLMLSMIADIDPCQDSEVRAGF